MDLEWNGRKADANLRKHGVTFREASTIFGDPFAVSYSLRGDTIRLISARLMTSRERSKYEQHPER